MTQIAGVFVHQCHLCDLWPVGGGIAGLTLAVRESADPEAALSAGRYRAFRRPI